MRYSILDGIFAVPYINLTSGPILIGFFLALGATTAQIGLVSMLPLAGGLLQPLGAQLIQRRNGWRKPVTTVSATLDALLWGVTLVCVSLLPPQRAIFALIAVLAVQQVANAFVGVSWTSWMSDLVPPALRGRYFGYRNFICNAFGAVISVGAGQFIARLGGNEVWSFGAVIVLAMLFRLISIYVLTQQPEPFPERVSTARMRERFSAPLASPAFRRYVQFGMTWGLAVHIASPFFAVYMIRDLRIDFGLVMIVTALATISNLLGQRFWGRMSDRYGHYQIMRLTTLVVVLQPFWWLFVSSSGAGFYLMYLIHVVGGFTWGGYQLASGNLMMLLAPDVGKSSYFATQAAASGVAGAAGPLIGGLLADGLLDNIQFLDGVWISSLPKLFLISFGLRLGSWGLLQRLPDPAGKPRLRVMYLIADAFRTSNSTQGFDPLLHRVAEVSDDDRPLEDALLEMEKESDADLPREPRKSL
jgi:MFS family permease